MKYKIHINDSNYTDWILYNEKTMTPIENAEKLINPIEQKLFNCDIFDASFNIIDSVIRRDNNLPGILLLTGKTYGRSKNLSGKGKETNRFYYKCIPNDKRLPAFLVPYEQKNVDCSKKPLKEQFWNTLELWWGPPC